MGKLCITKNVYCLFSFYNHIFLLGEQGLLQAVASLNIYNPIADMVFNKIENRFVKGENEMGKY